MCIVVDATAAPDSRFTMFDCSAQCSKCQDVIAIATILSSCGDLSSSSYPVMLMPPSADELDERVALVAALQRLAFAAVFTELDGFAIRGGVAEKLRSLDIPYVTTTLPAQPLPFEGVRTMGTLATGRPSTDVVRSSEEQLWAWRNCHSSDGTE